MGGKYGYESIADRCCWAASFHCNRVVWAISHSRGREGCERPTDKGADVRVESRDGKQLFNRVKTDGKGHYVSQGLKPGVYRVSLVVNGAMKASIMNTSTKADQATQLNFDLKPTVASPANAGQAKGKHMVWMPASTGTHTGGRWVEVDDNAGGGANALNVKRGSAEAVRQQQMQGQGPQSLPGVGGQP